jgi:hypothetical protein
VPNEKNEGDHQAEIDRSIDIIEKEIAKVGKHFSAGVKDAASELMHAWGIDTRLDLLAEYVRGTDWVKIKRKEQPTLIGKGAGTVSFTYTNWKGKTSERKAKMEYVYWGSNEWHTEKQWLVCGYDLDKKDLRTYALKDIKNLQHCEEEKT